MLKEITVNLNAIENMLFFWQSAMEGEKVSEFYLDDLTKLPEFSHLFDETFTKTSFRTVLSAITNKERLNSVVQKERQFWSKNMYMMEDPEVLAMMITPVKTLNLDHLIHTINEKKSFPYESADIIFTLGFAESSFTDGNKLYINIFKIMVNLFDGTNAVTIEGKEIPVFIEEALLKMT